jgi:hypothetical protein
MTTADRSIHDDGPVEVCVANNDLEAQVVKSFLESNGIPVMLQGDAVSKVYGFTVGGMAEVRVFVPGPLAAQAIELLEAGEEESEAESEDLS